MRMHNRVCSIRELTALAVTVALSAAGCATQSKEDSSGGDPSPVVERAEAAFADQGAPKGSAPSSVPGITQWDVYEPNPDRVRIRGMNDRGDVVAAFGLAAAIDVSGSRQKVNLGLAFMVAPSVRDDFRTVLKTAGADLKASGVRTPSLVVQTLRPLAQPQPADDRPLYTSEGPLLCDVEMYASYSAHLIEVKCPGLEGTTEYDRCASAVRTELDDVCDPSQLH
jgi:hypothetical protein